MSFDFRDNGRIAWENEGYYSTELHTTRVQDIIRERNKKPFFIYMAYQNAHSPWEASQRSVFFVVNFVTYFLNVLDNQKHTNKRINKQTYIP